MAETLEELIEEPEADEEAPEDAPLRVAVEDDAELGCSVEGGLVRL
jgi:hypothetical protein